MSAYPTFHSHLNTRLDAIRAAGTYKRERTITTPQGAMVETTDGRPVLNLCANNYLGLAQHPGVKQAAHEALEQWGYGLASVRFICGTQRVHKDLENSLTDFLGTEDTILYGSCFDANGGLFETLLEAEDAVISDELNHASIIDGCRASRSEVVVARHGDVGHVAELVDTAARSGRRALVVTDAVFSMDGDLAPVDELAAICDRTRSVLVLDEAHSVLGGHAEVDLDPALLLRVGTLSKTLGSVGGFVAAAASTVDLLINRARPFIFSTATTPADAAAALAALEVLAGPDGAALVDRLRAVVDRVRPGHPSPILPVVIGDEAATLAAAADLFERGVHIPAIRPPTVPPGTCRLRVALSAEHTDEMIDDLVAAMGDVVGPDALRLGAAPRTARLPGA
jgi:glycine C-acetyltransferase